MNRPVHIDLDELETSARRTRADAIAEARGKAKSAEAQHLVDVQERASDLDVALVRFLAGEAMRETRFVALKAVMSSVLYTFCTSIADDNNDRAQAFQALAAVVEMTAASISGDTPGRITRRIGITPTVGGNA